VIATYKREVIDRMDRKSTVLQFSTILTLRGKRHFSLCFGGVKGVTELPCVIILDTALHTLQGTFSEMENSVAKLPEKLTELRSSTSLLIFGFPREPETRELWIVSMLFRVCFRVLILESLIRRSSVRVAVWTGFKKNEDLPFHHRKFRDLYKKTRETLWAGRRIEEIKLFRYFQDAANRLNSMSMEELLNFCRGILQVLPLGAADVYLKTQEMHHVSKNQHNLIPD
jgi:hypothetical protein